MRIRPGSEPSDDERGGQHHGRYGEELEPSFGGCAEHLRVENPSPSVTELDLSSDEAHLPADVAHGRREDALDEREQRREGGAENRDVVNRPRHRGVAAEERKRPPCEGEPKTVV